MRRYVNLGTWPNILNPIISICKETRSKKQSLQEMLHGEMLNTLLLILMISHEIMGLMTFSQWFTLLCSHWPPLPSTVPCPLGPLHSHRKDPLYFQVLHTHLYKHLQWKVDSSQAKHMTPIFIFPYYPLFTPLAFPSSHKCSHFYFDIWSRLYCDRKHVITERQKFPANILEMWQNVAPDPQHMHTALFF